MGFLPSIRDLWIGSHLLQSNQPGTRELHVQLEPQVSVHGRVPQLVDFGIG